MKHLQLIDDCGLRTEIASRFILNYELPRIPLRSRGERANRAADGRIAPHEEVVRQRARPTASKLAKRDNVIQALNQGTRSEFQPPV